MTAIDQYRVVGNPIAHSKSPQIHRLFAAQTGQAINYKALCAPLDGFAGSMDEFFADLGCGANITVPFKLEAMAYADQLSERASRAGAVNTLVRREDGSIFGDNTDGIGMVRDIRQRLGWTIGAARVLILGAGGAVRGVLAPLLAEAPAEVYIANRTVAKAAQLADAFADLGPVRAGGFGDIEPGYDLIINGTAASLAGELPPLPAGLGAGAHCYDMMYGAKPTVFMQWGQQQGAAASADGLGMLVEQAAESFYIWRDQRPDTAPVMAALRAELI
ncbi:MAG: shikimate dehydrogenase [Cellvibrionaceae bacterium]|nr:shikimate dehydrogenase [Cellvibrionaceae bacterium]MCV6626968.1 shikimate dehydrogenase [Cellvibrionaceae bacterium]